MFVLILLCTKKVQKKATFMFPTIQEASLPSPDKSYDTRSCPNKDSYNNKVLTMLVLTSGKTSTISNTAAWILFAHGP